MVNLFCESTLALDDARKAGPKEVSFSTILRWVTIGALSPDGKRVRLDAVRLGGRWITSREALQRFAEALTPEFAEVAGA
jgi:hypothetical protein